MASLRDALVFVLRNEGGWVQDKNDPGGETYRGVSRVFWPNWVGWAVIDTYRDHPQWPAVLDSAAGLQEMIQQFYAKNFWRFDGLTSQSVATKVLDICVNLGLTRGVKILQQSLRYVSPRKVSLDGQFGPETAATANEADPEALDAELRAQQCLHYFANASPTFLVGLIRRGVK